MKLLILLAVVALAAARPEDPDYSRYDDFNIDEVIENERLFKGYVACLHGTGKCTPEGKDLKKWLPEGIQNKCGNCSDKQKVRVAKVIVAAQEKYPEDWNDFNNEHNPDGKHDADLKEFLEQYGH